MKDDLLAYLDDILRSEGPLRLLSPDAHSRITLLTNCFEAEWRGMLREASSVVYRGIPQLAY
jgi:hypothetical protein